MQTLKTAAIVVLLMTVLYGAYVSMTTPPAPLPQGVEMMLVEQGLDGFPDDFNDFGIDTGIAESSAASQPSSNNGEMTFNDSPAMLSSGSGSVSAAGNASDGKMNFGAVDQAFADVPSPRKSSQPNHTFQMSDLNNGPGAIGQVGPASMQASRLPDIGNSTAVSLDSDAGRDYPSTGSAFTLPDPAEAISHDRLSSQTAPSPSDDANQHSTSDVAMAGLTNAIATADRQYASDRRREALATLSLFYETPNLTRQQREQLLVRLDPLAREVIYSPEHLLEEPHRVTGSETLMDIAKKYDVPWQLLANINGVDDPVTILPGTDLKVLRGPFRADVDLANQELTLFLGDLYAGRFPVGVGSDPVPRSGTYTIQEKNSAKTYYDMSGNPVPPGNARNPYGTMWIDLGSGISLHGSPNENNPTDQGCISVAGNYSRDVFGILSEGSSVTIR